MTRTAARAQFRNSQYRIDVSATLRSINNVVAVELMSITTAIVAAWLAKAKCCSSSTTRSTAVVFGCLRCSKYFRNEFCDPVVGIEADYRHKMKMSLVTKD